MTKIFYDTEFYENGRVVDLISIGMVNYDTGDTFYAVSNEFDTRAVAKNEWLMNNVMTSIPHQQFVVSDAQGFPMVRDIYPTNAMSRAEIKEGVLDFTSRVWPDFWAWYSSYDHVCLAQLFGKMVDLPNNFPMFTSDIKQLHKAAGSPKMPAQPEGLHNALEDAKFNIVRYEYLIDLQNRAGV